jgi:hypothetical protein
MIQNQLNRYGAISRLIPELAPSAKVFLVGDSDDTTYGIQNLAAEFPPDGDGVVRVYSTIQAAVNAATANRGDVILVAPNHVENFTRADTWATAGVQIIGMGHGDQRPGLTYNDSGATVNLAGNGIRVSNLMFLASTDSIGIALDLDTGFYGQRVDNCMFTYDAATDNFKTMIRVASKESVIEDNRFIANDTAGAAFAVKLLFGEPDHLLLRNNYIYGQYDSSADTVSVSPAPIGVDTTDTSDTNLSGLVIQNNTVINTDTASSLMMRVAGGTLFIRGMARDNYFASYDSATADTTKFAFGLAANQGVRMINNYLGSADTDALEKRINDSFVELV